MKKKSFLKYIFIVLGSISLILGVIGIFLPLLPTTPFLLLTASLYVKSSDRFYQWLISNKYLGTYIEYYHKYKAIPLKVKIISILLLWSTILCSAFLAVSNIWIRILLITIATGVTIHISLFKTLKNNDHL